MDRFYSFLTLDIDNYTEVLHPSTKSEFLDYRKYIKVGKKYKMVDWARDSDSPYYNKHIDFTISCPIIEVENKKLIMLYYSVCGDKLPFSDCVYDPIDGICEVFEIGSTTDCLYYYESDWLERHDVIEERDKIINSVLGVEEFEDEFFDEDIFRDIN